jgi:hypothetical protein
MPAVPTSTPASEAPASTSTKEKVKKTKAKKAVKKTAKKATKTKAASNGQPRDTLGPKALAALKVIAKGPKSRTAIGKAIGVESGFCSLLGHIGDAKSEPGSLVGRGFARVIDGEPEKRKDGTFGEKGPAEYEITAAGKKYLENLK